MERAEAIRKLTELVGKDLRPLADEFGVTVWKNDKINKGWAGHVIECHLGLALNSSRSPNFGSWELKVVPLKRRKDQTLQVKETMAITMIDAVEVKAKEFEDSHLFNKLRKIVIASRIWESKAETSSELYEVARFDLDDPILFAAVKADYDAIRAVITNQGFEALSGKMGVLVQPRTKGTGHGSTSRAFYARTAFVAHLRNMQKLTLTPVVPEPTEPEAQESESS